MSVDLEESLARLYKRRTFGVKLGLDVEQALLEALGDPHRAFGSIHVAGTNGKGSVCAMLDSVLRAAGLRSGLYTSPHLVRFNERFRVAGEEIADPELVDRMAEVESGSARIECDQIQQPTFFEFATALAFCHFRSSKVALAVVETGLGGRLDATNVLEPLVSVITSVGLEHTAYLGPDLASVAGEKAGIIKDGRPVVCGVLGPDAAAVVAKSAAAAQSDLIDSAEAVSIRLISESLVGQVVEVETPETSYGRVQIPLLGRHQLLNLSTAIATLEVLGRLLGRQFAPEVVKAGIGAVRWPGRLQVLEQEPPVLCDGAHNPQAAQALASSLKRLIGKRPLGLVLGLCDDKDLSAFLKPFAGMVRKIWAVPIRNERSRPAGEIHEVARRLGLDAEESDLGGAMAAAREWAGRDGGCVCVTGSLFLVGELLEMEEDDVERTGN